MRLHTLTYAIRVAIFAVRYSPGNCRLIPQRINASRNPAKAVSHLH